MSAQQMQLYAMRGAVASLAPADQAATAAAVQALASVVQTQGRFGVLALAVLSSEIAVAAAMPDPGAIDTILARLAQS